MNNLNDLFKKKLSEQQFDGKEKYWAQLDKKLTEHAQEKVVIAWYKKWLLPVFVAITAIAVALYLNQNDSKLTSTNNIVKINQTEQISNAQEIVSSKENTSDYTDNTKPEHENDLLANQVVPNASKNDVNETLNKSVKITENNTFNNTNSNSKNNTSIAINHTTKSNYNPSQKTTIGNKADEAPMINKEPMLSNHETIDLASAAMLNTSPNKNASPSSITNHSNESANSNNSEYNENKGLDFSQIEMPLAYISPKALSKLFYNENSALVSTIIAEIPRAKAKPIFSLSVYGGAMYGIKNLMVTKSNSADYINRRRNEEKNTVLPNAGIDVEFKRGHWTLTSGLNFHQQGEKRNYSSEFNRNIPYDSLVININNNSAWIVDTTVFFALQYNNIISSQDTTITYYDESTGMFFTASLPLNITQSTLIDTNFYYLIDSSYHQSYDTVKTNFSLSKRMLVNDPNQANLKGRNTFSYVELPILVGYEWGVRRWRLSVKGGIGLGMLTRQQSFYLSNDESEIAPVSTNVYTKIMYNGILKAGLHYSFTPQLGFDIMPFSRININNMTNKDATFQQKYSNFGLQLGLNYKL